MLDDHELSDEQFGDRLEREYRGDDAAWERDRQAVMLRARISPGTPDNRTARISTATNYSYNNFTPRPPAARQLTFGAKPTDLVQSRSLERSMHKEPETPPRLRSNGIRLSGRARSNTAYMNYAPIVTPSLYVIPNATDDKPHIFVTPPTPLQAPPMPEAAVDTRSRFLADPLEMSALALTDAAKGMEVVIEAGESVEEEEDDSSDSGSDETIRPKSHRNGVSGDLANTFDTPTDELHYRHDVDRSPPADRRPSLAQQRRVLFGSPVGVAPAEPSLPSTPPS
jgi:hypothetical protein